MALRCRVRGGGRRRREHRCGTRQGDGWRAAIGIVRPADGRRRHLDAPSRKNAPAPDVRLSRSSAATLLPRLIPIGLGVGLAAGFFGIGGGFLIVPGLMLATAMPIANAVGTSLVVVSALGLTTAASYAASGMVDWPITALMIAGGAIGTVAGMAALGPSPRARACSNAALP